MERKYTLGQVIMFGFSLFFLVSSGVLAFQINSDIEHAVQTVKRIIVTSDGTIGGDVLMELNPEGASNGETAMLKIQGNMIVGEVNGLMTNKAEGQFSSVGGGQDNRSTGNLSYIGGGESNKTYASHSTVGGGKMNQALGSHATIPGGLKNKAHGNSSLAAGYRAEALHNGSFVRSDMSNIFSSFQSSTENQFLIRAGNGVGINTNDTRFGSLNISAVGPLEGLALYAGSDILARLFFLANNNFYIARAFSDTAGIVIDQEGDVGIGNMEPANNLKLDVEGNIGANNYCDSNGNNCTDATDLGGSNIAQCKIDIKLLVDDDNDKQIIVNPDSTISTICDSGDTCEVAYSNCDSYIRDYCSLNYISVDQDNSNGKTSIFVRHYSNNRQLVLEVNKKSGNQIKAGMGCRRFN